MRACQRGFTMIELTMTLVVAIGLIAISTSAWRGLRAGGQNVAGAQAVAQVAAAVREIHPRGEYQGLTTATLIAGNGLPDGLLNDARTGLVSPWGRPILVGAVNYRQGTNNAYRIELQGVPKSACSRVLNANHENFQVITVNGAIVKTEPTQAYEESLAVGLCAMPTNTVQLTAL